MIINQSFVFQSVSHTKLFWNIAHEKYELLLFCFFVILEFDSLDSLSLHSNSAQNIFQKFVFNIFILFLFLGPHPFNICILR